MCMDDMGEPRVLYLHTIHMYEYGESQVHPSQSALKCERNTEVMKSRAGEVGVAIGASSLGWWEVDLRLALGIELMHHRSATSGSKELEWVGAIKSCCV